MLAAALSPLIGAQFSSWIQDHIFRFLNPKIVDDMFGITVLVVVIVSLVAYVLSHPNLNLIGPLWPLIISSAIFLASLVVLLALKEEVLPVTPAGAAYLARLCFVGFFGGFAGCTGSVMAPLLNSRTAPASA